MCCIGLEKSLAARLKRDSPLAEQLNPLISQGWYLRRAVCASDRDGCTEAPSEQSRGLWREGSHGNCSKSTGKRHFFKLGSLPRFLVVALSAQILSNHQQSLPGRLASSRCQNAALAAGGNILQQIVSVVPTGLGGKVLIHAIK